MGLASHLRREAGSLALMLAAGLVLASTLIVLIPIAITDTSFISALYNEGWNLYHAQQAANGQPLYGKDLLRVVNYPYLSFYFIGWLGSLTGLPLVAARATSLLGWVVTVIGCAVCVRAVGGNLLSQVLAAILFAGLSAVLVPDYIGVADPQFLAQALSITGLVVHLRSRSRRGRLLASPLILVCSLFTKQQEIAVPVAVLADMVANHRRELPAWLAVVAGLSAVFMGLGFLAGEHFLARLLMGRRYSLYAGIGSTRQIIATIQLPLAAGVLWVAGACPRDRRPLFITFGLTAFICLLGFGGGEGVWRNIALDLLMWTAIASAWGVGALLTLAPNHQAVSIVLVLAIGYPVELQAFLQVGKERHEWVEASAQERAFRADVAFISQHGDSATCETMLLCYEAGRPLILDPFNVAQLAAMGALSEDLVTGPVQQRQIAVIQLDAALRNDRGNIVIPSDYAKVGREHIISRFTEDFLRAVWDNYRLDHTSRDGAFYVPRP